MKNKKKHLQFIIEYAVYENRMKRRVSHTGVGVEDAADALLIGSDVSSFGIGGCDMTIGCGGAAFDVLIIGFICVDPTFIVGVVDCCCIVLFIAAVFNIFAKLKNEITFYHSINSSI